MNTRPAQPGVVTRPRLVLLTEVQRGRVRWLIGPGSAVWRPATGDRVPVDVTELFLVLLTSGWAYVVPVDEGEVPPPLETPCATTGRGDVVLGEARRATR